MKVDESSMGKYAGQNIRAHSSEEGRQMWCGGEAPSTDPAGPCASSASS